MQFNCVGSNQKDFSRLCAILFIDNLKLRKFPRQQTLAQISNKFTKTIHMSINLLML